MDAAEKAYEAAKAEIARVKKENRATLGFQGTPYRELTFLPTEIETHK